MRRGTGAERPVGLFNIFWEHEAAIRTMLKQVRVIHSNSNTSTMKVLIAHIRCISAASATEVMNMMVTEKGIPLNVVTVTFMGVMIAGHLYIKQEGVHFDTL